MADRSDDIRSVVERARAAGTSLYIRGGDSKRGILGRACKAEPLDMAGHCGIVDYQPAELYLTARAGTPLAEIEAVLAEQQQTLPCESPQLGTATLGGTLACNLSGPARPWAGSIRDLAMGVQLVNGQGELLTFGGKVMKNVAGYDVTRLQAGALGTLGVITELTVKVLPRPEHSLTLVYEMEAAQALATMNRRAGESAPLSGACWLADRLYLRLAGATSAVMQTAASWGGEQHPGEHAVWQDVREMRLACFDASEPLWRFSVGSSAPLMADPAPVLIDWCGAQRWVRGDHDREVLQGHATAAGGHVSLFRGGDRSGEVRPPLSGLEQNLQRRLKQSFDPDGLFNPGRLYSWL
jgi:glycolate oxidase FAD binding subunit